MIAVNMSHTDRIVALIDMDCFYCQVEEKLDPKLAGKPIAVVQYNQWKGGGIIAVNYPAREKGVTRQMRGDEAREKCPDIELPRVPQVRGKADLTKYREAGKQVAEVLMSSTKILERASIDEAYLDLTEAVNTELKNGLPIISLQDMCNTFVVGQETADFMANIYQNRNSGFYEDDIKLLVGGFIVERIRAAVYEKTERLQESLRIPLITNEENAEKSTPIFEWTDKLLKSLGFLTHLKYLDVAECNGPLPCVILGNLETGNCPNKTTILIYSHLSTQKENIESPQSDKNIYGKDVLNLGSMIAWLNTIESFKNVGIDYPVNIKLCVAPVEVEWSEGLKNLLNSEKESFLDKIDFILMNEGSWLQPDVPSLVKKLRGLCYFSVEVRCSKENLDSNKCVGIIQDAMNDLLYLLGSLMDEKTTFSGLCSQEETSADEMSTYENTDLDVNSFMETTGANSPLFGGHKSEIVRHRLMVPNFIIHGIKTSLKNLEEWSIPSCVCAQVSIRTFHSNISDVFEYVDCYLEKVWSLRGSSNTLNISLGKSYETWNADVDNVQYKAAAKAAEYVYGKTINFFNNTYTIPVINLLNDILGKNILLLPIVSENNYMKEALPLQNYLDASKMCASYLYEMGQIPKIVSRSSSSFVSCQSVPEICVCGKFDEEIQAASGDSDGAKPKSDDEIKCVCPYRVQTKDAAVISENIIELNPSVKTTLKPCKCVLQLEQQPIDVENISLVSNASTASKDPTPVLESKATRKKNITPSVDTINCSCTPNRFKISSPKEEKILSLEEEESLKKSMRSVGSKISGISACIHSNEKFITPNLKKLGCMCPERSQETVCEIETQKDRMFCPVIKEQDGICNKGGKRKHHIAGPPLIDEEESEISLGPLSHCSCSEESITVVPNCDCPKGPAMQWNTNIEDEID